jgi:hypothetical protein
LQKNKLPKIPFHNVLNHTLYFQGFHPEHDEKILRETFKASLSEAGITGNNNGILAQHLLDRYSNFHKKAKAAGAGKK